MEITSYKDLLIWQKGKSIALAIYTVTANFSKEEVYGLSNQMRCCAISIPSNIAEGWGRNTTNQLINFLKIAKN